MGNVCEDVKLFKSVVPRSGREVVARGGALGSQAYDVPVLAVVREFSFLRCSDGHVWPVGGCGVIQRAQVWTWEKYIQR